MSRSGYSDDYDNLAMGRWRGVVASAIRGKRGQSFLKDLAEALDDMPVKRLIAHELEENGEVCALGAVGLKRGIEMKDIDPEDYCVVANSFDIATPLAQEIVYHNDEWEGSKETPEDRWVRMRKWVDELIKKDS